jgi:DNA-directed RNA polymerase
MQLTILVLEERKLDKRKQKSSAAPNLVHSYDAAHLVMTVTSCDFPTATVHDSFGCLPGDMEHLFETVREQFVDFHKADPLSELLKSESAEDLLPERGSLLIESILSSDYAFL